MYLYQRWLYPVDKKRVNEFGRAYEDDENGEEKKEHGKDNGKEAAKEEATERKGEEDKKND